MNRKVSSLYPTIVERSVYIIDWQFGWYRGLLPSHFYMGWRFFYLVSTFILLYYLGGKGHVRFKIRKRKS